MLVPARPLVAASFLACGVLACSDSSPTPSSYPPFTPSDAAYPPFTPSADAAVERQELTPSIGGRWGLLQSITESTAVILSQEGNALTGLGCAAGLPDTGNVLDSTLASECGPIGNSRIDGRRVTFEFHILFAGGFFFAADAYVSEDGNRLAGRFAAAPSTDGAAIYHWQPYPTAWARIGPKDSWLERRAWPADTETWNVGPGYDLALQEGPDAGEFTTDRVYRIWRLGEGLVGDLGSFTSSELEFTSGPSGETTGIVAGPVPETAPNLPVRLELNLENGALVTLVAETPSGATYSFGATKHVGP